MIRRKLCFVVVSVIENNSTISLTDKYCTCFACLAISTLVMVWIMIFVSLLLFVIVFGIRGLNVTQRRLCANSAVSDAKHGRRRRLSLRSNNRQNSIGFMCFSQYSFSTRKWQWQWMCVTAWSSLCVLDTKCMSFRMYNRSDRCNVNVNHVKHNY